MASEAQAPTASRWALRRARRRLARSLCYLRLAACVSYESTVLDPEQTPEPGSWQDRIQASKGALIATLSGARVPGVSRLRRNVALHSVIAPAVGFAQATVKELRSLQRGARLGCCTPRAKPPRQGTHATGDFHTAVAESYELEGDLDAYEVAFFGGDHKTEELSDDDDFQSCCESEDEEAEHASSEPEDLGQPRAKEEALLNDHLSDETSDDMDSDMNLQLGAVMCKAQGMLIKGGDLFSSLIVGNFSLIVERLSTLGVPQELISSLVAQAMECQDFHDSLVHNVSSATAPSSSPGLDDLD